MIPEKIIDVLLFDFFPIPTGYMLIYCFYNTNPKERPKIPISP